MYPLGARHSDSPKLPIREQHRSHIVINFCDTLESRSGTAKESAIRGILNIMSSCNNPYVGSTEKQVTSNTHKLDFLLILLTMIYAGKQATTAVPFVRHMLYIIM